MDIAAFWRDTLEQNRTALHAYFTDDAKIFWHCSNEEFSVDEFKRANCDYPGEWDGTIERIEETDDKIITVVNVYPKDRSASFHVVSFFKLKNGLIERLDEYWADDAEPPEWRKKMSIGKPIR